MVLSAQDAYDRDSALGYGEPHAWIMSNQIL